MPERTEDFKVTITPEALRNYRNACDALTEAEKWSVDVEEAIATTKAAGLTTVELLVNEARWRGEMVAAMRLSLHRGWGGLTGNNLHTAYDGDLTIYADGKKSWGFVYGSGYSGGLIFHAEYGKVHGEKVALPVGTWSVHT